MEYFVEKAEQVEEKPQMEQNAGQFPLKKQQIVSSSFLELLWENIQIGLLWWSTKKYSVIKPWYAWCISAIFRALECYSKRRRRSRSPFEKRTLSRSSKRAALFLALFSIYTEIFGFALNGIRNI